MNNQCTDLVFAAVFGFLCTDQAWPRPYRWLFALFLCLCVWLFFC